MRNKRAKFAPVSPLDRAVAEQQAASRIEAVVDHSNHGRMLKEKYDAPATSEKNTDVVAFYIESQERLYRGRLANAARHLREFADALDRFVATEDQLRPISFNTTSVGMLAADLGGTVEALNTIIEAKKVLP